MWEKRGIDVTTCSTSMQLWEQVHRFTVYTHHGYHGYHGLISVFPLWIHSFLVRQSAAETSLVARSFHMWNHRWSSLWGSHHHHWIALGELMDPLVAHLFFFVSSQFLTLDWISNVLPWNISPSQIFFHIFGHECSPVFFFICSLGVFHVPAGRIRRIEVCDPQGLGHGESKQRGQWKWGLPKRRF